MLGSSQPESPRHQGSHRWLHHQRLQKNVIKNIKITAEYKKSIVRVYRNLTSKEQQLLVEDKVGIESYKLSSEQDRRIPQQYHSIHGEIEATALNDRYNIVPKDKNHSKETYRTEEIC